MNVALFFEPRSQKRFFDSAQNQALRCVFNVLQPVAMTGGNTRDAAIGIPVAKIYKDIAFTEAEGSAP